MFHQFRSDGGGNGVSGEESGGEVARGQVKGVTQYTLKMFVLDRTS